jgi:uncharacterized phosphosugar-binding protein
MSAEIYLTEAVQLIEKIQATQMDKIQAASRAFASSILSGRAVHVFGSGHSVLPVQDIFPRYGAYVGFHPIMDPRLMWFNIVGPGGARELLWLEREPGYIRNVLLSQNLDNRDSMLVFSHGGMNSAGIEIALAGKEAGLTVVGVSSLANRAINKPKHPSGKSLHDVVDILIDNCSPPEDALVPIEGLVGKVAASSTLTFIAIAMSLVAETAAEMARQGTPPERVFVSPNVSGVPKTNNEQVFEDYAAFERGLWNAEEDAQPR